MQALTCQPRASSQCAEGARAGTSCDPPPHAAQLTGGQLVVRPEGGTAEAQRQQDRRSEQQHE
jgi:hypothetical protein